jgi:hypothetical protein
MKRRSEKRERVTPAMMLGLARRPWQLRDLLHQRLFFEKATLSARWQTYYRREVTTLALTVNRSHRLRFAF